MQTKHRHLLIMLFGLFLAAGSVDLYFIYASVIPQLFNETDAKDTGIPQVPAQKEPVPKPTPPLPEMPIRLTIPNDDIVDTESSAADALPAQDTAVETAGNSTPEDDAAPTGTPQKNAVTAAETVQSGTSEEQVVGTDTPSEHGETKKAKPMAEAKQLPGITPLRFGPNKTLLWKYEKQTLREVAKTVSHYANVGVRLIGHADDQEKTPDELGEHRAQAAKAFLVKEGVPSEKIEIESVGARKPATRGTSGLERKKNRRVRVRLIIKE